MTEYIKDEVINEIFNRTKNIIESTGEYSFTAKVMRLSFIMNTVYERILKHSEEPISGGISGYSKQQLNVMKNWNFKINNGKIKKFKKNENSALFQPFFDLGKDQFRFFFTEDEHSRDKIRKCIYEEDQAKIRGSEIDDDLINKVTENLNYEFNTILSCLRNGLAHGMISIGSDLDKIKHNQSRSTVVPISSNTHGNITELIIVSKSNKDGRKQNIIIMDEFALDKFCDCFQNYLHACSIDYKINFVESSKIHIG